MKYITVKHVRAELLRGLALLDSVKGDARVTFVYDTNGRVVARAPVINHFHIEVQEKIDGTVEVAATMNTKE